MDAVAGLLRSLECPLRRAEGSASFSAESAAEVRKWVVNLNLSEMLLHRLPDDDEDEQPGKRGTAV